MKNKSVKSINPNKSVIQTSYDIITKGHSGTLQVEAEDNDGITYRIKLIPT